MTPADCITAFGFVWGPMRVERTAADDEIGFVLTVWDAQGRARAEVRASPKGKKWRVRDLDAEASSEGDA